MRTRTRGFVVFPIDKICALTSMATHVSAGELFERRGGWRVESARHVLIRVAYDAGHNPQLIASYLNREVNTIKSSLGKTEFWLSHPKLLVDFCEFVGAIKVKINDRLKDQGVTI